MLIKVFCFFFCFTFGVLPVWPQLPSTLNFKHLTTENGLSQGVVEFILKDSKGFMWFTSHDGINRFDGTTCLSNEQIGPGFTGGQQTKGLAEDITGNIWIGTGNGIFKFSYFTGRFEKIGPDILEPGKKKRQNSFFIPAAFAEGWLLVHRDNAPAIFYHTITRETRIIPNPEFGKDGKIEKIKLPAIKALAHGLQTLLIDSSKVSFARVEEDKNGYLFWKEYKIFDKKKYPDWGEGYLFSVRDSILVITCTGGQLLKVNLITREVVVLGKWTWLYHPLLFIDEQFQLWFAPETGGMTVFDLKTNSQKNSFLHDNNNEASISRNRVSSILKADDNTLWLGIWGKGVDYTRLTDNGFSHHLTPSEVKRFGISNFVRGIVQAKDGLYYANTQFGGIIQLDEQLNFRKKISDQFSASIYIDPEKENIYFGDQVVFRYNLQSGRVTPLNKFHQDFNTGFPAGPIYQYSVFERNKILAAGVMNLMTIDPELNEISQLPGLSEVFNRQPIYSKQVKSGNIYVNTSADGLFIFRRNGYTYQKIFNFTEKFVTKHIWEENDSTHWIGTSNGLYDFNPISQTIKVHYSAKNGLPNNVVYAIAPDTMGRLWVSTNKGLASLLKTTGRWTTYKNFSGTQGNEYNSHTVVTAADGRIIFGGVNGLTVIRPWEVDTDYPFPTVQITAIKGDSSYNPYIYNSGVSGPIAITAGDNTLEFDFIGIDYNDPSACKLRYRLKEADKDWVESSNPGKARYVQLAPGNYTFEVMAANANGDWSNDVRSVEIQLAAFWWQWKWLQVLFIMVIIGTIILMARLQVKRSLYKKQMLLEKEISIIRERERITADLHDDVGATLSSLNIYGDLAHSIWEANPEKSKEMVGKIAGQSRELMLRMSDIIWSMKPNGNDSGGLTPRIRNFAQELLSGKGILVDISIDETVVATITNPMVRKNIILIIKEAMNNVAKYSNATHVEIFLGKKENGVHLSIMDDGIGFERDTVKMGNGLGNMAARCRQMEGSFEVISHKGQGTTIACSIPIAIISYRSNH